MTWSDSSSEGGSAGGQKAVLQEPCFTSVGLGVGGLTRVQRKGCLGRAFHSPSQASWLVFSNCVSDTWHLRKIWKIKKSNKNKKERKIFH